MEDYSPLILKLLKWGGLILGFQLVVAAAIRLSGVFTLTVCPKCESKLKRSKGKRKERNIRLFGLGLLPVRRYRCYTCYWEDVGIKLNEQEPTSKSAE